jgi:hypothetical protein
LRRSDRGRMVTTNIKKGDYCSKLPHLIPS